MNVRYVVGLTPEERRELETLVAKGTTWARKLKRAQVLLAADAGTADGTIAATIGVSAATIYRLKRRCVERGVAPALIDDPRPGAGRKLSAKDEALLVAVACSKPPVGRALDARTPGGRSRPAHGARPCLPRDGSAATAREGAQAVAEEDVVHPRSGRRVRRPHGGRAGPVHGDSYAHATRRVLRRDPGAVDRREAQPPATRTRAARAVRL